jgi:hypothetical protein
MNILSFILIILLNFQIQEDSRYFNNKHEPSSWGIKQFVDINQENIIKEYESKINDTLYDVYIYTEDLSDYNEELGEFYVPDNIVITNQEKYIAYEFKDLTKFSQKISVIQIELLKVLYFMN